MTEYPHPCFQCGRQTWGIDQYTVCDGCLSDLDIGASSDTTMAEAHHEASNRPRGPLASCDEFQGFISQPVNVSEDQSQGIERAPARRRRRCRRCHAAAGGPPILTVDHNHCPREWFLCEYCWLLLEVGFRDLHPQDDFYQYLTPLEGRLSDTEVYLHVLRGSVICDYLERLVEWP